MKGYSSIILFVVFVVYVNCFYKIPKILGEKRIFLSKSQLEKIMRSDCPQDLKEIFFAIYKQLKERIGNRNIKGGIGNQRIGNQRIGNQRIGNQKISKYLRFYNQNFNS